MEKRLRRQAEQLHDVFVELVRRYQFRDREEICCHGISVSQCYALDALAREGPLTMGALAAQLVLEISTMTRVVDRLVNAGLANRQADPDDRRVRRVAITRRGEQLVATIRGELIGEYERVLREVPAAHRDAVIEAIGRLLAAFQERQSEESADRGKPSDKRSG